MKQLPLPIAPKARPTFDNFVPGADAGAHAANAAALAHLRTLPVVAAPVYLWGAAGSGKTHLLRGLAAQRHAQGQVVGWFDAAHGLPWALAADWSVVIIDRCEALAAGAQQAAFSLFVDAATHGVQVVAAGRLPPVDLPLRDDLRTRLAWGHVFALRPLADADTRAALRREADRRGILLSEEVLNHVLSRFPRDLGNLMQLLDRLDAFALAAGRRITLPLLRLMLAENGAADVPAALPATGKDASGAAGPDATTAPAAVAAEAQAQSEAQAEAEAEAESAVPGAQPA